VEDTGIGVEENLIEKIRSHQLVAKGSGVGLSNILQRLQVLFGPDANMEIQNKQPRGTIVILHLPV